MSRHKVRIVVGLTLLALSIPALVAKERLEYRRLYAPLTAAEEEAFARKYAVGMVGLSTANRIIEAHEIHRAETRQRLERPITTMRWILLGLLVGGLVALLGPGFFPQPMPMHAKRGLGVVPGRRPLRRFGPRSD